MEQITNSGNIVQQLVQTLAPVAEQAGLWLGKVINNGIDNFVDLFTTKQK